MYTIIYYDNVVKKGKLSNLQNLLKYPLWIDLTDISEEEASKIGKIFSIHPLTIEDLRSYNSRIKVEEFSEYLFSAFYGIKKSRNSINLVECDFVIGKNFLISNHKELLVSHESLKKNKIRLEELFKKGPDFIFHNLIDKEVDNYFPILGELDDQLSYIEEEILKKPHPKYLVEILDLKKLIRQIKRIGFQQRDKLSYIAKTQYNFISKKAVPYFRDVYDHAIRVSDSIDNYRESVSETFDAYMSALNNNMNEVMKVLSVFATIALPMTVISGIYGTNFTNLPGSRYAYGFWIMITIMFLFSVLMVYMFKKRGWF